jgi:outer membrane biosynthesis protein TonB
LSIYSALIKNIKNETKGRERIMRFNGYRKNYWKMALLLVVFVFLFLPGCSQTDKGDAPKKVDAPAPQKVETPAPAPEPAKAPEPTKAPEPVKAPEPAKTPGDVKKPPAKPATQAGAKPGHNPDYDP